MCCYFPSKKVLLLKAIFGIVMLLSHQCPFAWLPPSKLAHDVSCPCWLSPLGLLVRQHSLPAMSCALVGKDRWGLLYIRLACLQYQSPCGATTIRLAVKRLAACPWSRAFRPWPLPACFLIVVLIVMQPLHTFCTTAIVNVACLPSRPSAMTAVGCLVGHS